jgi:hypothetical protein
VYRLLVRRLFFKETFCMCTQLTPTKKVEMFFFTQDCWWINFISSSMNRGSTHNAQPDCLIEKEITSNYNVPKAFQVFIIYYKVSRYFLTYVEILCDILGSTATSNKILWKLERRLGDSVDFHFMYRVVSFKQHSAPEFFYVTKKWLYYGVYSN